MQGALCISRAGWIQHLQTLSEHRTILARASLRDGIALVSACLMWLR